MVISQMAGTMIQFAKMGMTAPVKSIGNSTTTPRDLEDDLDVWIIQMALAESVAARLRKHGFKCKTDRNYGPRQWLVSFFEAETITIIQQI